MEVSQQVGVSPDTKKEIEKKLAMKLIKTRNYFFQTKFGTNGEISKLREQQWSERLKPAPNQMLAVEMCHHVCSSGAFLIDPILCSLFTARLKIFSGLGICQRSRNSPVEPY